jgi:TonB family protein
VKRSIAFFCSLLAALSAAPLASLPRAALAQPAPGGPKLTRAPKLVKFVEAVYPEAEKAAGKTASVVLRLGITAEGKVDGVIVTGSAGAAFDDAAVAAAKQFEFEPAEIDGKPAAIRIEYRYDFVLREEPPPPAPTATAPEPPPGAPPAPEPPRPPDTDDLELVVVAPPTRKQVVSTEVNAEQARRVAGTQGDVLKVVENLPGVARSSVGSGQLVVWGAAPQDTRVYIDGVRVPLLYHSGGLRSVVASDLVQGVELSPGAYGAAYGRGLGGLVTVQLRPLEGDGFHGAVSADFLDASALVRASAGAFRFAAAARHGYLDALLPLVTKQDTGALFQVPRYYDGQVRAAWAPSPRTSIEVGGMLSSDTVQRTVASADPSLQKSDTKRTDWQRVFARYRTEGDDGAVTTLTPWGGADAISQVSRFGRTPTELSSDSVLLGLRATHRRRVLDVASVTLGLDAEAQIASLRRAGSVTSPPREGDVHVFGQPPSDQINVDRWGATIASVAPYAEADVALLGGKLHVLPGLRFEPYLIAASRRTPVVGDTPSIGSFKADIELEPRLAVTADVSPRLRVKAGYGLYHQPPQAEDLSAVFGSPLLSTSTAHHFLAGAAARVTDTLSIETTAFLALTDHLAARSQLAAPLLAEALVQVGAGRAYGAQLLVRKELSAGFFGWISYSLLRSERQDAPGGRYRLFDFDQTHVFTLVATHELPWGIEVGTRLRIASGMPRTPVVGASYDAQRDLYQPVFGDTNTTRIPPFVQVDVRASKKLRAGPTELEIYLDVQNVTNRSNPEEIVYSDDYTRRGTITGLPILPSLGARCAW